MTVGSIAHEPATTEVLAPLELDRETRGLIAEQVGTAKRYPRSVQKFLRQATELVTLDEDTAEACIYALPRAGKTVEGASARFAEIAASCWGNLRIDARVVADDGRMITARGTAWDLEHNVLISYEVQRRITDKSGKRFSDDMIVVTGNAASSIALRNAVLKAIPAAFWKPLYLKAKEVAVGTSETLVSKRTKMLAYFQKLGAPQAKVFTLLEVGGEAEITLDHIATLRGLATAIREGDTTLDEAFAEGAAGGIRTPERKSAAPAAVVTEASPAPPSASTMPPEPVALTVVQVHTKQKEGSANVLTMATLSDGSQVYTYATGIGADLTAAEKIKAAIAVTFTGTVHQGLKELASLVVKEEGQL